MAPWRGLNLLSFLSRKLGQSWLIFLVCRRIPYSNWCTVFGGYRAHHSISMFRLETLRVECSVLLDHYMKRNGVFGVLLIPSHLPSKKMLRAHLVFLSVLAGTPPLDRIASCSSSMNVEKCLRFPSRVELVFELSMSAVWGGFAWSNSIRGRGPGPGPGVGVAAVAVKAL